MVFDKKNRVIVGSEFAFGSDEQEIGKDYV